MKIEPGMMCTFDSANNLDQNDTGISHVIVLELKKHKLFGPSLWIVQNADDPKSEKFICAENALKPLNVCAIRYPSSVPNFNESDADAIRYAIDIITASNFYCGVNINKDKMNRLRAVYEKIQFYNEMRDV